MGTSGADKWERTEGVEMREVKEEEEEEEWTKKSKGVNRGQRTDQDFHSLASDIVLRVCACLCVKILTLLSLGTLWLKYEIFLIPFCATPGFA